MSKPDLQARGFTIQRYHPLDTIERRRAAVEQLTDRQWKYFSLGPLEWHVYPDSPPPSSLPPTISVVIVFPQWTTIIVAYTVAHDVEIKSVYAEVLESNYERNELKNAEDVPNGAVSYSTTFNFLNLAPGRSYIVKMYAVDTHDNITSREEFTQIVDMTAPVINDFTVTSPVAGQLKVDVNVTDDFSGAVCCSTSLY